MSANLSLGHQPTAITAPALRSRAMGIFISACFGAFWASTGLSTWHGMFTALGYAVTLLILIALSAAAAQLFRHARQLGLPNNPPADDRRHTRRRFLIIFIAEIVAMNIAAWLLVPDHAIYLMPVIAVIVGVHFYPLAPLFRSPHYHVTATVMTLAGVTGIVAVVLGGDGNICAALVDAACAATLWISGAVSWHLARRRLQVSAR